MVSVRIRAERMKIKILSLIFLLLLLSGCGVESSILSPSTVSIDPTLGIEPIPKSLGSEYLLHFNRYTRVVTPDGNSIHIVAQNSITNEQIVRARNVLEHYLRNLPGSLYGADKSAVANKMAENNAMLLLLNGEDDGTNPANELRGQPLYQNEIQVEGHKWYINQDYNHRDATFEEILHLVHDTGIGVDGNTRFSGALPDFQVEIRAAQENGLVENLWGIGEDDWIEELKVENSLSQEYLAAVIDAYYGLWGAWNENTTHGMWGLYIAKTRQDITAKDPVGAELINNKFFHSYLTYNARIDADFEGTFSLKFDKNLPYTHHSQYLKDVTLTGNKNSNVRVNQLDNQITGNLGVNTVIFSGNVDEYTIIKKGREVVVADNLIDRDGVNTLIDIENIEFVDQTLGL